MLEQNSAT